MSKGKIGVWITIGCVVVLGIGFGSYAWWSYAQKHIYTNDANIEAFSVNLSPDILARIITLDVDEGDLVHQGDLIAQLQDDILLAEKEETIARIATLQNTVDLQYFYFEKIRNDYERALAGIEDQVIPFSEFDHAQKDLEMAESNLAISKSDLEQSRKQLEVINTKLSHTIINAPMDGYISKRWVLGGDVMQPGQTMFTMYDLRQVWIVARVNEKKMRNVRVGDKVKIHIDMYPDITFHGKVFVIKGAAASEFSLIPQDNATGNYTKVAQRIPLKITIEPPKEFDNTPLYLFPGMSAEVTIDVEE
jgi:membrane fusion protein, multidrug efflux system